MNTGLVVIISILALYGLIILGRKIMNRNTPEGKFKGLKYFIEPYSSIGCGCKQTKGGLFNLQTITKCDCCNIDKKKNDIDFKNIKLCVNDDCYIHASFGIEKNQPLFCERHNLMNYENVVNKKCEYENCKIRACFGDKITKSTLFCFEHKVTKS